MSKEELEKAIEIGESVWLIAPDNKEQQIFEIKLNGDIVMYDTFFTIDFEDKERELYTFDRLYITKSQAEHYLFHANITRTETLPFLTWEEFNKVGKINFYDKNHCYIEVFINRIEKPYRIRIINHGDSYNCWNIKDYDYNEENFYKAYDECVKLFKGEE